MGDFYSGPQEKKVWRKQKQNIIKTSDAHPFYTHSGVSF